MNEKRLYIIPALIIALGIVGGVYLNNRLMLKGLILIEEKKQQVKIEDEKRRVELYDICVSDAKRESMELLGKLCDGQNAEVCLSKLANNGILETLSEEMEKEMENCNKQYY